METTALKLDRGTCCSREYKVYKATYDDPLAQICMECKYDTMEKDCAVIFNALPTIRRVKVVAILSKLLSTQGV